MNYKKNIQLYKGYCWARFYVSPTSNLKICKRPTRMFTIWPNFTDVSDVESMRDKQLHM